MKLQPLFVPRFSRGTFFLSFFLFLQANASASFLADCRKKLRDYVATYYLRGKIPSEGFLVKAKAREPRRAVEAFNEEMARILKKIKNHKNVSWLSHLLKSLSHYQKEGRLGNFQQWLRYVIDCPDRNTIERLYEGQAAYMILETMNVEVNFEPSRGFFSLGNEGRKSMDLQLMSRDKVVSYREVKLLHSRNSQITTTLKSCVGKAAVAREHASDNVELGAMIFVDSSENGRPLRVQNTPLLEAQNEFLTLLHRAARYLDEKHETPSTLDFVLIIDKEAHLFANLMQRNDGTYSVQTHTFQSGELINP